MKKRHLFVTLTIAMAFMSCEKEENAFNEVDQVENAVVNENLAKPNFGPSNDLPLTIGGPDNFNQKPWGETYVIPGESVPNFEDYRFSGRNPILDEQNKYSDYASNVPLDLEVVNGQPADWYQLYQYVFTNRSNKPIHLDLGVLIFRAPSGSNLHRNYRNNFRAFNHPQQTSNEVPIEGTPDSWYIARLVFHDAPVEQREVLPGESWTYEIGTPTNPLTGAGWITPAESKKTMRFIADLNGNPNEDMMIKFGCKGYAN